MIDRLISYLAPHPCFACGKIGSVLCDHCKFSIDQNEFSQCVMCEAFTTRQSLCNSCVTSFDRAWCVGERTEVLKKLIAAYKFNGVRDASKVLAQLLYVRVGQLDTTPYCIVPIPTIPSHIRQRGYDHAHLLAKEFAQLQNKPINSLLSRRTTTVQLGAAKALRTKQAADAFVASTADPDITYILVDDVITTGATLKYAAKALKDAGAASVWAVVIAKQPLD